MSLKVQDFVDFFADYAPQELAEDWDNVGLLLGDASQCVRRVLTCLTLTPDVAREAVAEQVNLVVTHHPILFRPIQRLCADDPQGAMLLELARANVSVYSPHTAFDSALTGVNQQLAELLQLSDILPIRPCDGSGHSGSGRWGVLPQSMTLLEFSSLVRTRLNAPQLAYTGEPTQPVLTVGIACGAAAEFMRDARQLECDVLLTGEARFHASLEARTLGIGLVIAGHYQTERPAIENLACHLREQFTLEACWASRAELDPVSWV
jgi:dinuclear metal center YbgI/SA1388 family protein